MNKLLLLLPFLIISNSYTQQKRKLLFATIADNIDVIGNSQIINLSTNQETYTNENGEFRILAKLNDSLKISFVGYKTKYVVVKANHFGMRLNSFILEKKVTELDEVILKKHNLFGIISRDMKQTPENVAIVKSKAPDIWKEVDPTAKFFGIGTSSNSSSVKNALKEKYYHFLEYCNPLNIEQLYKNGNVLEVIKILQEQSITYLKSINLQE